MEVFAICDICLKSPCDPRCPNAPDPVPVYICDGCGSPILEGEDAWHIQQEVYCEHCIDGFRSVAEFVGDY